MNRPTDWSPVGWSCDPIPGDPQAVCDVARRYQATAEAMSRAEANLRRLDGTALVSKAFQVTFVRIEEVASKLGASRGRVEGAAKALDGYWPALERAQVDSIRVLEDVEGQLDEHRRCVTRVRGLNAQRSCTRDPDLLNELTCRITGAVNDANQQADAVGEARARLDDVIKARDAAAQDTIRALDNLDESSPIKDNAWDKVVDWFEDNVLPTIKAVVRAVAEFAEKYGTIVDLVGAILSIAAACIPVVGPLVSTIISLSFAAISVTLEAFKIMNATFRLGDGEITVEEFEATRDKALVGIGIAIVGGVLSGVKGVRAAAKVSTTLAEEGSKVAAKQASKWAAENAIETGATEVVKYAREEVSGDSVADARRVGNERLHQERLQEEERMREVLQSYQDGTATSGYYRSETGRCSEELVTQ